MRDRQRRLRGQSRSALGWMLLFFISGHLLAGWYLHRRHPEFFDPEITLHLRKLSAGLAQSPGRPLALFLGSSRTFLGVRPSMLNESRTPLPDRPFAFNFALVGGGPVGERLVLHRLLHQGIKPRWLFIEVWPPLLLQQFPLQEEKRLDSGDIYWADVPILHRLYHRGWEAVQRVITETWTPLLHYRETVLNHYAPALLSKQRLQSRDEGFDKHLQYHMDEGGWLDYEIPHASQLQLERARRMTKPLFDHFFIHAVSHQALQELLEECQANDIQAALLLMPEHSLIRSWYPVMQSRLMPYLEQLSRQYHAPLLDTRDWQSDEDIPDYCHLSSRAAGSFSARFGREIYQPLLQGR